MAYYAKIWFGSFEVQNIVCQGVHLGLAESKLILHHVDVNLQFGDGGSTRYGYWQIFLSKTKENSRPVAISHC